MKTKRVGYFYPTSPYAEKFKMPKGGFYYCEVEKFKDIESTIQTFNELDKAVRFADSQPLTYDRYSKHYIFQDNHILKNKEA